MHRIANLCRFMRKLDTETHCRYVAFADKRFRARTIAHDVSENEILDVLSKYGIQKEMLPTEMGGSIELNRSEWIANRWAVEMEEI